MGYTFLTLPAFLVHWKSSGCIMQTHKNVDSPALRLSCNASTLTILTNTTSAVNLCGHNSLHLRWAPI